MWHELKQRKLVQWTVAYLAVAWACAQGLQFLQQTFDWPQVVVRVATMLLAAGLAATIVASWFHGERGAQRMPRSELIILVVIALAGVSGAWYVSREAPDSNLAAAASTAVSHASVAVLPFANMSGNPNEEHFSDGITEELLMALANVEGLRVPARTSTFAFKNVQLDIREIARRLDVSNVLEGTVRRADNRVKVTARLVAAADGRPLWSAEYVRELTDILEVQEDIARSIVTALEIRIGPGGGSEQIMLGGTANPDAHDAYLQGLSALNRRRAESIRDAIALFESATVLDSRYARAWGGLAQAQWLTHEYANQPLSAVQEGTRQAATRSLEIEPKLGEPHATLGMAAASEFDWSAADSHFKQALRNEPGSALVHHWYSITLRSMGRRADAIQFADRAVRLDNLSAIRHLNLAVNLSMAGQYQPALTAARAAVALDSLLPNAYLFQGEILLELQRHEDAKAAFIRRADLLGLSTRDIPVVIDAIASHHERRRPADGRYDGAMRAIERWRRLPPGQAPVTPSTIAKMLLLLDREDEALQVIEDVVAKRTTAAADVGAQASFDRLLDTPRYQAVLRKMHLPVR